MSVKIGVARVFLWDVIVFYGFSALELFSWVHVDILEACRTRSGFLLIFRFLGSFLVESIRAS